MENMNELSAAAENNTQTKAGLTLAQEDRNNIDVTCRWAKFLAILGFVGIGLFLLWMVALVLAITVAKVSIPGNYNAVAVLSMIIMGVILIVYFFPVFYLFNFASKGKTAMKYGHAPSMKDAFRNLRICMKFVVLMSIALMAFYVVLIVVMIIVS